MAWKTRGLRGSVLEEEINRILEEYRKDGLALIQKVPTPITPINIDNQTKQITLAYFDHKSTVDYIGAVQGIPVCFDAKECNADTFPLQNIHAHQIAFMEDFEKQKGIAFLILYFTTHQTYYYMPFREVFRFWKRGEAGIRKSFRYDELLQEHFICREGCGDLNILRGIQRDLDEREKNENNGT